MLKVSTVIVLSFLMLGCGSVEKSSDKTVTLTQSDERIVNWKYSVHKSDPDEINLKISADIKDGWMLYTNEQQVKGPLSAKFDYNQYSALIGNTLPINPESKYDTMFEGYTSYFINNAEFNQKLKTGTKSPLTLYITYQVEALSDGKCPSFTDTLDINL